MKAISLPVETWTHSEGQGKTYFAKIGRLVVSAYTEAKLQKELKDLASKAIDHSVMVDGHGYQKQYLFGQDHSVFILQADIVMGDDQISYRIDHVYSTGSHRPSSTIFRAVDWQEAKDKFEAQVKDYDTCCALVET